MGALLKVCAAALALSLVSGSALAEGALKLDDEATQRVRQLLTELEEGLHGATKGDSGARNALLTRAMMPRFFSDELNVFTSRANEDGQVTSVKLTGFEVKATLWLGVLPVEKVSLFFWVGDDEIRLLKLDRDERHQMGFFGEPSAQIWSGDIALAFGAVAETVLKTIANDQCDAVPLVRPSDVLRPKDDPRATRAIEAQRERSQRDCAALAGMPFNRLTWKLGSASGVVTTRKKTKLGFGLELLAGPERDIRVYRLTRPQGPR